MDQKIPFTTFDFWAFLSAGFLVLAAVDHINGGHLLAMDKWTVVQATIAMAAAYIVGQLVASLSAWLLEKVLVGKLLGAPRMTLFGAAKAWKWVRRCMPTYFEAMPPNAQTAVLEKAQASGPTDGDTLFWVAFAYARATPAVMGRLETFLNQYSFARNVAIAALLDAAFLYWHYRWNNGDSMSLQLSRAALLIGGGMLLRYLKYFRQYSLELFTAYAFSKQDPPAATAGAKP